MNAILRLSFFALLWKVAVITMIGKPGKPPEGVKSHRAISLLPITSKLFELLFLLRILEKRKIIPAHQSGFRQKHSRIQQMHRLTAEIHRELEAKKYYSVVFLDVTQAFDRVRHKGLLYKFKIIYRSIIIHQIVLGRVIFYN